MKFEDFDLHPDLLDGIDALNYTTPTPIQQQAIPIILEGKDLIGVAQTGTGKTGAFLLPVISQILDSREEGFTQALIIVPTRELAVQIDQVIEAYSYFTGISSIAIYGGGSGKGFNQEKTAITSGADIIVATPGRLIAHINLGYVDFSKLRYLVLDEADRMLDMGFQPDLLKIISRLNPERQTLLFSATMPTGVAKMAQTILNNPQRIQLALSKPAEGVTQAIYWLYDAQKIPLLSGLLKEKTGQRIIVFSSTKQAVNRLFVKLKSRNLSVGVISSDLEQEQREQVMLDFRNRKIDILVATDVVSRGIDVEGIDMVINYDVPRDAEDYVHRIGRTARAERKGEALTLVCPEDLQRFKRIEKLIERQIDRLPLPDELGAPPDPNARPVVKGSDRGRPSGGRPQNRPGGGYQDKKPRNSGAQNRSYPDRPAKDRYNEPPSVVPPSDGSVIKKKKKNRPKKNNNAIQDGKIDGE